MKYRKELLEELTLKAQQLRKDVVLSIGVGVAGHVEALVLQPIL